MTTRTMMGSSGSGTMGNGGNTGYYNYGSSAIKISPAATEAISQTKCAIAGVFQNMRVLVTVNARTTQTAHVFRVNGSDATMTTPITALTTGWFSDDSNTDSVSIGDLVASKQTNGTGNAQSITITQALIDFVGNSTNGWSWSTGNGGANTASVSTAAAYYGPLIGNWHTNSAWTGTTELAAHKHHANAASTSSYLQAYVTSNAHTTNFTFHLRINGSDGNQAAVVTALTTGIFVDTSNTDAIADGDQLNGSLTQSAGTGTMVFVSVKICFAGTSSKFDLNGGITDSNNGTAAGSINYLRINGFPNGGVTSETNIGHLLKGAFYATNLRIYFDLGDSGGARTIHFRINGANGSLAITIPISTSGYLEDTANVDALSAADLINISDDTPSQSRTCEQAGVSLDTENPGGTPPEYAWTSQLVQLYVADVAADARTSQLVQLAVTSILVPPQSTQWARLVVESILVPPQTTQIFRLMVARGEPCSTQRAQCWRMTRRDGQVFRFTSLDVDVTWGNEVFETCGGFNPSASEQSSELGSVGSQELEGIFISDLITEADLYGGKWNDAFIEVWLIPYGEDTTDTPKRIAAGWTGNLSHGERGFRMEVTGPGARMDQQALVQEVNAQCSWVFGSEECGFDREAVKETGDVALCVTRERLVANLSASSEGGLQWANGDVRFTSGQNIGEVCQVKSVDFDTGEIVFWILPPFLPAYGDTFDLLPGCDLSFPTCRDIYGRGDDFGGFPDVPGTDSLAETPDAKY